MEFTAKDFRYFNMAKRRADSNTFPHFPLGAVITNDNHLVSVGHNQEKTHTLQRRFNSYRQYVFDINDHKVWHYLHAEIDAIRRAIQQYGKDILKGATIYVYRSMKNGGQGYAKPCEACMAAIIAYGIRFVCFSTPEGFEKIDILKTDFS